MPFLAQHRRPLLAEEAPLLQQVQQYHQNQSGAQQLYRQNMAEKARQQAEYQRRLAADEVGVEPYSLFLGRQTEDPSAGFEFAPADFWPGSAAVKKGLLATAAAIPSLMYWNYARKNPVPPGMLGGPAFHGTPHKWESGVPDISKVDTGEGAQAYGHGIYFAENPDVAKSYSPRDFDAEEIMMQKYKEAEAVGDYNRMEQWESAMLHDTPDEIRARSLDMDYDEDYRRVAAEVADELEAIPSSSHLYEVDIPDADIDRMLDWDKPLSEQSESVQRAIKANFQMYQSPELHLITGKGHTIHWTEIFDSPEEMTKKTLEKTAKITGDGSGGAQWMPYGDYLMQKQTGGDFYRELSHSGSEWSKQVQGFISGTGVDDKAASLALSDFGIPGIKYLDQASRDAGKGTRNFVVFDEKLLNKLRIK